MLVSFPKVHTEVTYDLKNECIKFSGSFPYLDLRCEKFNLVIDKANGKT